MKRAAAILGIGTDHVYEVDPDESYVSSSMGDFTIAIISFSSGRVSAEKIEAKILYCHELGFTVFFVGITAGTTVLGAFDRIEEISFICRKYKSWLHVDVSFV